LLNDFRRGNRVAFDVETRSSAVSPFGTGEDRAEGPPVIKYVGEDEPLSNSPRTFADDRRAFAAEFKRRMEERRQAERAPKPVGNEELPRAFKEQLATKGTVTRDPETHDGERAQHVERVREGFKQTQPEQANGKTAMIAVRLPAEEKQAIETAARLAEITVSELVRRSATGEAHAMLAEYEEMSV
jgi:Mobilization protein NikA